MRSINFQNKKIINKKEKILLISGLIMLISFLGILGEIDRAEVQAADCSSSFTAVSGDGPDITQSGNDWCGWNTPPGCTGDPCDTYVGSGSYSFCSGNTMQSFECTCSLLTGCNCTNFTEQTCGSCADAQYIYASDTYQPALCLPTTTTTTTTTVPTTTTTTTTPSSTTSTTTSTTTSGLSGLNLPSKSISDIIADLVDWLLTLVTVIAILMLVIGGVMYLVTTGDEMKLQLAKRIIVYAIVGLFVCGISYIIVKAIADIITK